MKSACTFASAALAALALSVFGGCGEDTGTEGSGSGTVAIQVSGEGAAVVGYPYDKNGHRLSFADGWRVTFSKFIVSVGALHLHTSDGKEAFKGSETYVADLHKGPAVLATYRELAVRRWDRFHFRILPPTGAAVNVNGVAQADLDAMIRGKYNYWIEGAAEKGGKSYSFRWGLRNPTQNSNCTNGVDGKDGFVVTNNGVTTGEITVHVDHLFWDSLGSELSSMRFDAIAAATRDDTDITFDELGSQSLTDLRGLDGTPLKDDAGKAIRYNAGSVPLASSTLASFVLASSASQAHVNGLGLCTVKSL
ncbi:hypothetical protein [Pendulispora albinea]|uniref:Lipoprotein n=1 Tax=Pendulispora albinea TaxID=2741071 RepID=A0ABZ2LUG6_9BACT